MEFSLRLFRIQVSIGRVRIELQYRRSSGDQAGISSSRILDNELPIGLPDTFSSHFRDIEVEELPSLVESIGQ